jgi:hypothetical protein
LSARAFVRSFDGLTDVAAPKEIQMPSPLPRDAGAPLAFMLKYHALTFDRADSARSRP